jgi:hypothetical protein
MSTESEDPCCDECEERTTRCDRNIVNNVWVEGVVDPAKGKRGICMLDSMSVDQIIYVLQHDPRAREDLPKVTSDQEVLGLLTTVPLLGAPSVESKLQRQSARTGLPYYTVFRGNPPIAPPSKKP